MEKNIMLSLLKGGEYTGEEYSVEDIVKLLPVFEHIIKPAVTVDGVRCNNNWFWLNANKRNQNDLLDAVKKIKTFDESDEAWKHIKLRYIYGDGYGILKPVPRSYVEPFNEESFNAACKHYSLNWFDKRFAKEHYFKVVECWQREKPFFQARSWGICEKILGVPLNYAEYLVVDSCLFGDARELKKIYLSEEYTDIVLAMRAALEAHNEEKQSLAQGLIDEAEVLLTFYDYDAARKLILSVCDIFSFAEGDSPIEKKVKETDLATFLVQIPEKNFEDMGLEHLLYKRK